MGAERAQLFIHPLVSPIDLFTISDESASFCAERGENQRHAGADVGAADLLADELGRAGHDNAMGIADDDLRAHGRQLVDEIETAFKHLFVNQDRTLRLGGDDNGNAHHIGRKGGPGGIIDLGNRAAEVGADAQRLLIG